MSLNTYRDLPDLVACLQYILHNKVEIVLGSFIKITLDHEEVFIQLEKGGI